MEEYVNGCGNYGRRQQRHYRGGKGRQKEGNNCKTEIKQNIKIKRLTECGISLSIVCKNQRFIPKNKDDVSIKDK